MLRQWMRAMINAMTTPTLTNFLPLEWDPALVEEAVLRATCDTPADRELRRERDLLYPEPAGERREAAFRDLHGRWFARLGLDTPVRTALDELPLLATFCARGVVWRALSRGDAGADLHVRTGATPPPTGRTANPGAEGIACGVAQPESPHALGAPRSGTTEDIARGLALPVVAEACCTATDVASREARTVVIRVPAIAFARPDPLLAFLREELLHVSDMLDPAFGYEPDLADLTGEPAYLQLLRDRYRMLWKTTVQGRLCHRHALPAETRRAARHAFGTTFPMLEPATLDEAFGRFFDATRPDHGLLAGFASRPNGSTPTNGLSAGCLCPLCRLPTHAPERGALEPDLLRVIRTDFPSWQPGRGLCRQCADLYRASTLSRREAAALPG